MKGMFTITPEEHFVFCEALQAYLKRIREELLTTSKRWELSERVAVTENLLERFLTAKIDDR